MRTPRLRVMTAPNQITPRQARVRPLLFVLGMDANWGLYAPNLLQLARSHGLGIHVLETGAPLGTGSFTSNAVQNEVDNSSETARVVTKGDVVEGLKEFDDPHPSDVIVEPAKEDRQDETTLAWPDTFLATAGMREFVRDLVKYFQEAGFAAGGDWKPDFNFEQLPEYARRIGATVVALPKAGFPGNLIQGALRAKLEEDGLRVELLEEVSQDEIAALERQAGSATMAQTETPTSSVVSMGAAISGQRPLEDLIGRRAHTALRAIDDTVLLNESDRVTQQTLEAVRRDNLENELLLAVETESTNDGEPTALRDATLKTDAPPRA
jgi:hypothetical protein